MSCKSGNSYRDKRLRTEQRHLGGQSVTNELPNSLNPGTDVNTTAFIHVYMYQSLITGHCLWYNNLGFFSCNYLLKLVPITCAAQCHHH